MIVCAVILISSVVLKMSFPFFRLK